MVDASIDQLETACAIKDDLIAASDWPWITVPDYGASLLNDIPADAGRFTGIG